MFSVQFRFFAIIHTLQKGQGVYQSPNKMTIYASLKLVLLSLLLGPPRIGQQEVHGEEALRLSIHFFLQTSQQF